MLNVSNTNNVSVSSSGNDLAAKLKAGREKKAAIRAGFITKLKASQLWGQMSADEKALFEAPVHSGAAKGPTLLEKLGLNKIGASFTLIDYVNKTNQGLAYLRSSVKSWTEKGYEFEEPKEEKITVQSRWTLKKLPAAE